ncbi:MAG: glycosyltransferase, partial [Pirellulales bacterium]|nr:glycosyltransferase [Pirellulales bacterium]
MKVFALIDTLAVGGTEQSLLEIMRRLHTVNVVVCQVYRGDALRAAYDAAGVRVVSLDLTCKYGIRRAVRLVEEVVKDEQPDLIHACLFRAGLIGRIIAKQERMPIVDSFVNDSYCRSRFSRLSLLGKVKLAAVQRVDRLTARWVTHFAANSHAIARSNAQSLRIDPARVTVIHRGRNPAPYLSNGLLRADPAALGLSTGQPLFLNVGRLLDRKGQAELLQALSIVQAKLPLAHLVIAGEGPYRARLEQLISDYSLEGRVHLLGQRNDVPEILSAVDMFVFPSYCLTLGSKNPRLQAITSS